MTAKQVERLADKLEYLEHDLLHIVVRDEIVKRFLENADDKNVIDFSWFYYDLYKPIYYREMIYEIIVEAKKDQKKRLKICLNTQIMVVVPILLSNTYSKDTDVN